MSKPRGVIIEDDRDIMGLMRFMMEREGDTFYSGERSTWTLDD